MQYNGRLVGNHIYGLLNGTDVNDLALSMICVYMC